MRIYRDFVEAKGEITRDLAELGIDVFAGYQSKDLSELDREKFTTRELQNYGYTVVDADPDDLDPVQPWATAEWADRVWGIEDKPANPGSSWKYRPEIWAPLLESNGKFSYTYSERLYVANVPKVIEALKENPASRQCYIPIWNPHDAGALGHRRVPCSLGYHVMIRNGKLLMTYTMRSSDFHTHWDNDVWLALKLQEYIADFLNIPTGDFTHILNSLHTYKANLEGVF